MLGVLPLLTLGACVAAVRARVDCWRTALLVGAVVWGAVLIGATEALSVAHVLTLPAAAAVWLIGLAVFGAMGIRAPFPSPPRLDAWTASLLGVLAALVVVLGATAAVAPPNTLDSLTYHLPRVVHWIHNATLEPYPTHEPRQLYLQPAAEFAILHLQLLSGGDYLAGLVQWASMVGSLVGTSLIARELGVPGLGQLVATLFAASVPIGVLEATSTQNDYAVTFWLVCLTFLVLRLRQTEWRLVILLGLATGLAVLTKATAYVFAAPMLAWLALRLVHRQRARAVLPLASVAGLAFLLNAGFYARNLEVFGSPLGPLGEGTRTTTYLNETLTPALFASNVVRDLGVHLVATPLFAVNAWAEGLVRGVHVLLQVDPADPRTTWGTQPLLAQPPGLAFDENYASNPLHLLLLVAAAGVIGARRNLRRSRAGPYALALVAGFVFFAALLRWQPWHSRLELPLFVLGAPLVSLVVDREFPRVGRPLAMVLLVSMLPWVVYNQARPLVGPRSIMGVSRSAQYFANLSSLLRSYAGAAAFLAEGGCSRVGLLPGGYEYLFWAVLEQLTPGSVDIEGVDIDNLSAKFAGRTLTTFEPCAVLAFGQPPTRLLGRNYEQAWSVEPVTVLTLSAQ